MCLYIIIDGANAVAAAAAVASFKSQPVFDDVSHILFDFRMVC
jgi:hypothetical protein